MGEAAVSASSAAKEITVIGRAKAKLALVRRSVHSVPSRRNFSILLVMGTGQSEIEFVGLCCMLRVCRRWRFAPMVVTA